MMQGELLTRFCQKCFKDSSGIRVIDTVNLRLCKGCDFELRSTRNFLAANRLVIRHVEQVATSEMEPEEPDVLGSEGVVKGDKAPGDVLHGVRYPEDP